MAIELLPRCASGPCEAGRTPPPGFWPGRPDLQQLEDGPDFLVDQGVQSYGIEAALLESYAADVVAGALEGVHCVLDGINVLLIGLDFADDGTGEVQGDQTFLNFCRYPESGAPL